MGFVDKGDKILGKIVDQDARPFAWLSTRQGRGIVLYARTVAHLFEHFDIVLGPGLDPLGFQELILRDKALILLLEFRLDPIHGPVDHVLGHDKVLGRVHHRLFQIVPRIAREGIKLPYPLYRIEVELYSVCLLGVGGVYLDDVTSNPEASPVEYGVVPFVLEGDQVPLEGIQVRGFSLVQVDPHVPVQVGRAQSVDTGDRRYDDYVPALHECCRGREPHPVDFLVDARVLFDVEVLGGNIGLWLVVIVIGNEVLDGVFREKSLKFPVELG